MNDKGPCGTPLDFEGESFYDVLKRHYAYNFTDLQVTEFDIDFDGILDFSNDGNDDPTETSADYAFHILNHLLT